MLDGQPREGRQREGAAGHDQRRLPVDEDRRGAGPARRVEIGSGRWWPFHLRHGPQPNFRVQES